MHHSLHPRGEAPLGIELGVSPALLFSSLSLFLLPVTIACGGSLLAALGAAQLLGMQHKPHEERRMMIALFAAIGMLSYAVGWILLH